MNFFRTILIAAFSITLLWGARPSESASAEKEKKPPVTQYWMSISTQNMSIPGMSGEGPGMGGFLGKMMGSFGPSRTLTLLLNSPRALPADPKATHDIPPGQKMGETLPLMVPEREKPEKHEYEEREEPREKIEKPKARMLIYWGCGEEVRKGQPRVLDTEKMSMEEFGKAMASLSTHTPSRQYPPSERKGWIYADWPNRKSTVQVPKDSSLVGDHLVHGNYTPDIKFSIGRMQDFMAPVEFTSVKGDPSESMRFEWKALPTATGYLATAMAHNDKTGETIFWSSSEVPEAGFGLMDYLTNSDVQKFLKEKVVMEPKITSCNIPRGIFKDAAGMLQFIAYGEELNLVHPPKPKDPKQPWNPIWTAKVRLKSTGMTMLGEREEKKTRRSKAKEQESAKEEYSQEETRETREREERQVEPEERPTEKQPKEAPSPMKKLRGIFGF